MNSLRRGGWTLASKRSHAPGAGVGLALLRVAERLRGLAEDRGQRGVAPVRAPGQRERLVVVVREPRGVGRVGDDGRHGSLELGEAPLVAAQGDDVGAELEQARGAGLADALARAGDEHALAREGEHGGDAHARSSPAS